VTKGGGVHQHGALIPSSCACPTMPSGKVLVGVSSTAGRYCHKSGTSLSQDDDPYPKVFPWPPMATRCVCTTVHEQACISLPLCAVVCRCVPLCAIVCRCVPSCAIVCRVPLVSYQPSIAVADSLCGLHGHQVNKVSAPQE